MTSTLQITPLMQACQNDKPDEVKALLLQQGHKSVNVTDSTNRTALFYCAENTNTKSCELLCKGVGTNNDTINVNLNHQDKDGYSCLHVSVINGNTLLVEYLIKNGADVNITDSEMHSVLHWAVVTGHVPILDILISNKADPETADIHGAYPIHYAAQMCGQIDNWDETIIRDSSQSLTILKKLIEQKVKIDVEDYDQRTPIIWAASSGSSEALLELYKAGSDPLKHEKDGLTALHCAASRGHLNCLKVLIEQCQCSVNIMDNNNCTPIFYAATLNQPEVCEALINYGANLHVQDSKGRTVYHCAAARGQLNCLKIICQKNADIWLKNRRGDTPIHEAFYNKKLGNIFSRLLTFFG
jgi:ankyrin repeat protein